MAYIDKETGSITKFEGTERILKPLKRKGKRGSGEFEEVSWESALDDIGGRIRKALLEKRATVCGSRRSGGRLAS